MEKRDEFDRMLKLGQWLYEMKEDVMRKFNLKSIVKLRKALEYVVEEEEKRLGVRKGYARSGTYSVAEPLIFILLIRPPYVDKFVFIWFFS